MTREPGRYQPTRAGIVSLYQYGDQTFDFAGGRLLLRGHNTSGKTKALELLLPFCLDGDISPRKLDPFARNAKEMKWNLVGCCEDKQRIGYAWLELGRLGEQGMEYVTCAVGMKASRDREGVRRWYCVAPGRRIGLDLELLTPERKPLTRSELQVELGDDEALLASPGEYRRRLNELVFRFPSMEQYRTMIGLMLELRRPHLSKNLDPGEVTRLLSAALPEVDGDLMRRLGEGLEQLDELQASLAAVEDTDARVRRFHERAYRPYAGAVVAARADALRAAGTAHDGASATRRRREQELEAAAGELARIGAALERARAARDAAEGEREALLASPEWTAVAEVEQLSQTADQAGLAARAAAGHRDDAAARLAGDEAESAAAAEQADRARERVGACSAQLGELAGEAAFSRHAALVGELGEEGLDPERWAHLARAEIDAWLAVLAEHERLLGVLEDAARRHDRAREEEEVGSARARGAGEAREAAADGLDRERELIGEAVEAWAAGLRELALSASDRAAVAERAMDAGAEDAARPEAAVAAAVRRAESGLLSAQAALSARGEELARSRAGLEAERERLLAEQDEPPAAHAARPAARDGRPGAPLWALVDFRDGLDGAARAGIEGALEGAGLLDAWVTPDGRALDPDTLDAALVAGPRAGERTLADVLVAVAGLPVEVGLVAALLESVALEDERGSGEPGSGERDGRPVVAVARDGAYRSGPLTGRFARSEAIYVGAPARAARRARRLTELESELSELERRAAALATERETLDGRLARLEQELRELPDTVAVERARRELAVAERHERDLLRELEDLHAAARAAAERRTLAAAAYAAHAEQARIPGELEQGGLRALGDAARGYRHAISPAAIAVAGEREARARAGALAERLAAARTALAELGRRAEAGLGEARRLAATLAERESALGASADELRRRKGVAEESARDARADVERLHSEEKGAAVAHGEGGRELDAARSALAAAIESREGALEAFRELERGGWLALALAPRPAGADDGAGTGGDDEAGADDAAGAEAPAAVPGEGGADAWTFTRALEVARRLPLDELRPERELSALVARVERECAQLDRELAQRGDLSVVAHRDGQGSTVVSVADGPRERTLGELLDHLAGEIAQRRSALTAEESRVFGDALLEEIADHLRRRIARVDDLVADMNVTLARCPTGSGRTIELDWRVRDDDELRAAVKLLRRSLATLGERERAPLVAFLRGQIERARQDATLDGTGDQAVAGHLRRAFDYRAWYSFELAERHGSERVRLTRKRHAQGSGGEQAVLVHLPLFAAAAALYDSSEGRGSPRLVMLDEALSGIDDRTRERVMHALVQLDLDFVMTSHELWGTYHTVPELSVYQLHRDNDLFGVFAERFLWDGELLREGEQAGLL